MPGERPRLIVAGCGSHLAGDDSVGLEIVHRLEARARLVCELPGSVGEAAGPPGEGFPASGYDCTFRELSDGGLALLEWFPQADVIVFVDAVQSGAPPGTLHFVPLPSREVRPRARGAVSTHAWGLEEALELARALGHPVPPLWLLGIELASVTLGSARAPAVEAAVENVVLCFPNILAALCGCRMNQGLMA